MVAIRTSVNEKEKKSQKVLFIVALRLQLIRQSLKV